MTQIDLLEEELQKLEVKYISMILEYRKEKRLIFEKYKEVHKQQIIDAFDEGQEYEYQVFVNSAPRFFSDTYYNETYGSKGSNVMTPENHIGVLSEAVKKETTFSQTEISDEEIEKAMWEHFSDEYADMWSERLAFRLACKWYREQLKQRQ